MQRAKQRDSCTEDQCQPALTSLRGLSAHPPRLLYPARISFRFDGIYILIIILSVNGLDAPTKRHRLAEWIQKQDPYICCLQVTHFRPRDTYRLKVRGWKKIFHADGNQKKAGVAILISDKTDFKTKTITRDKGHYIMIKGSIQEEDITIVNIYAPNIGAPQYIRQILTALKGEMEITQS